MVRKWQAIILAFVVFLPIRGASQQLSFDEELFAPFVSRLEAEVRNNLIRLSWQDSPDIRGPVFIYRLENPFSGPSSLSTPVEVPYGTGSYLDEAENPGQLQYFVVSSDEWGRKYTISIPYTNTISINLGPELLPGYYPPGSNQAVRPIPGPTVEGITARIDEDRVILSFTGLDRTKNLILYRSLYPLRRPEDLLSALIIRQKVSSPFIDRPLPGVNYYYALLYEEDMAAGMINIRPGYNATAAVKVPQSDSPANSRLVPLPGINLNGSAGPVETEPAETQRKKPLREVLVFPEDLRKGGTGEEYQLRSIVQGYFFLEEWEKAAEEFQSFLELPRTEPNRARARFYLGQIYYFQGKGREALLQFLESRELYPGETNPWIETVLGGLVK